MGSQKLTVNDCSLTHLKLFFEWLGRSACNDVWKFAVIDPCLLALFGYRTAHIWHSTNSFSWIHWRLLRTASGYTEALPLKEARAWLESINLKDASCDCGVHGEDFSHKNVLVSFVRLFQSEALKGWSRAESTATCVSSALCVFNETFTGCIQQHLFTMNVFIFVFFNIVKTNSWSCLTSLNK